MFSRNVIQFSNQSPSQLTMTHHILIIDSQVDDHHQLVAGAKPEFDVFVLDAHRNGIEQITQILNASRLTPHASLSLHIVSHGSPGTLYLGNSQLSLDTLERYAEQLQSWFTPRASHLAPHTLYLYGCNVAAGDAGEQFLIKLQTLVEANIAASQNPTGHTSLNGDWDLAFRIGDFFASEASLAFTESVQKNYSAILAAPVISSLGGPYSINEGESLTLNASATDADGDPLTYEWDINGDGVYGDVTGANPTISAAQLQSFGIGAGSFNLGLRVLDGNSATIGIIGNNSNSDIQTLLVNNGYNVVFNPVSFNTLGAVFLLRADGNAGIVDFVQNQGGRVITEWTASEWVLDTVNLLNADNDFVGFVGTGTPITFTAQGTASGLSSGVSNPYSDADRTEFFQAFSNIGAGVNILATRPGNIPVILSGQSGAGDVLVIGYDWADAFSAANASTRQLILNSLPVAIARGQVALTVDPNTPPTFTSANSATVEENSAGVVLDVNATDVDGDTLTYSITGGADAARFSINNSNGELSFVSSPNYEDPSDSNDDNIYEVQVTANDGNSGTTAQTINVTVTNVNDAPVIGGSGNVDKVLILAAEADSTWIADVESKLETTELFDVVDIFNIYSGTPTLAQLQNYDSVLLFTDYLPLNPTEVGNILADYVDAGGGVVLNTFAFDGSYSLEGRWSSGGYSPIQIESSNSGTPLTLGTIFDPNHPILDGVSSFSGGSSSYHNTGDANPNATVIANWSNGRPLIVDLQTFNAGIVGLNFFAPSSDARSDFWDASTDGDLLMGNALEYVGNAGGPIDESVNEDAAAFTVDLLAGAFDEDGDTLSVTNLTLTSGDDAGVTINGNSLEIDPSVYNALGTGESEVITYSYDISDGNGGTVAQTATITINGVNDVPEITSSDTAEVEENSTAVTTVVVTDVDGDPISYSITGGADATRFSIDSSTGELSFVSSPNYEDPSDSNDDNIYEVQVTANDGNGGTIAQTINVTVTNANEAPVLKGGTLYFSQDSTTNGLYTIDTETAVATSIGISGVTSSTVGLASGPDANTLYGSKWFQLMVINTDGSGSTDIGGEGTEGLAYDPNTNILYGNLNGSFFSIDPATGNKIQSLAAPGGDPEGLEYANGFVYGLLVGGELKRYDIASNTWTSVGNTGIAFNAPGLAYDPQSGLLYGIGSAGLLYSINPDTAQATLIGSTGLTRGGGLAFVVDDGGPITEDATEDSAAFTVNLLSGAFDPDDDTLSIANLTLTGDDAGVTIIGNSLEVDPSVYNALGAGESEVITYSYDISDGNGGTLAQTATITINGVNDVPEITSSNTPTLAENSTVATTVVATDADGDPISYSISGGVDAALFEVDATTGELSFITAPDFENPTDDNGDNLYEVTVSASDGSEATTQTLAVSVVDLSNGVTDFNNDNQPDVVWRRPSTGQTNIWFTDGQNKIGGGPAGATIENPNWLTVGVGDFDKDGKRDDILWRNVSSGANVIWFMDGINKVGNATLDPIGTNWEVQGVGDFDHQDYTDDILWRNQSTGQTVVWTMDGTTKTGTINFGTLGTAWKAQGVGDFEANNFVDDIVWRNYTTGQTIVWETDGQQKTGSFALDTVGTNWKIDGVGDLDGDGTVDDLLWYNTSNNNVVTWFIDNGTKVASSTIGAPSNGWDAVL